MQKVYYSEEPQRLLYLPQRDGTAEVFLRKNIAAEEEGFSATEVFLKTRLSEAEIDTMFESFFYEEPETTVADLVEAIDILTSIILEG